MQASPDIWLFKNRRHACRQGRRLVRTRHANVTGNMHWVQLCKVRRFGRCLEISLKKLITCMILINWFYSLFQWFKFLTWIYLPLWSTSQIFWIPLILAQNHLKALNKLSLDCLILFSVWSKADHPPMDYKIHRKICSCDMASRVKSWTIVWE